MGNMYQFRVEGYLDFTWSEWLGVTALQHRSDGTTEFVYTVTDQAALYGVLLRLCNTGVTLIAAQRVAGVGFASPVPSTAGGMCDSGDYDR